MYTVIVADDEQEIRRSLIRKVDWGSVGFQVIGEAENGAEALELTEKLEPDLLLTDIRMPFISGIELARQVREIRPATQIAFLSGFDDFSYAQQAIQYNIISYLLKPISSSELEKELLKMKEKIDQKFQVFSQPGMRQEHMEKREFLTPLLLDGFGGELPEEEHRMLMKEAISCGLLDGEEPEALNYAVMVTRILDKDGKIKSTMIIPTGGGAMMSAEKSLEMAVEKAGIKKEDIVRIVTTGYGRAYIDSGDDSITEITCHAKGAHYLNPNVRTVIDIGGQDIKAISIDENGAVKNFLMNDKCAAGTGRFLEMMARTLGLSLEEMSTRGLEWKENVVISSMCTVFAESEVVSLVAQNKDVADIIHGLNVSVASKVGALAARLGKKNPGEYMMTGGVAKNKGIIQALEEKLGAKLYICDEAQLCGALGAALFAYEKCNAAL